MTFAAIAAIGTLVFFLATLIYFLNFKVQIFQHIIDEYHYNTIQEVPLALISSDIGGEAFIERFNKAYFFGGADGLKDEVTTILKRQFPKLEEKLLTFIIKAGDLDLSTFEFGNPACGCNIYIIGSGWVCNQECGAYAGKSCSTPTGEPSEMYCHPSLMVNVSYFHGIFPLPLVFNGTNFTTTMRFEAYA